MFHIGPTALEISLVCGILTYNYGWQYALVTLSTMSAYSAFTVITTSWRTKFRKEMNAADNQAASSATDALLNHEAVKYYNNESFEAKEYDKALEKYEKAAIKTTSSLAFLNIGQNAIFSTSLAGIMWMTSQGILDGALTVGDLVMVHFFFLFNVDLTVFAGQRSCFPTLDASKFLGNGIQRSPTKFN